ncbi:MAG: hypothetical protein NTW87_03870 [Planctomycetota bacterium]|nr:hypothetical protein [Planctomycetota bacterium]
MVKSFNLKEHRLKEAKRKCVHDWKPFKEKCSKCGKTKKTG